MGQRLRGHGPPEQGRGARPQQVAEDVDHDDAGRRELDVQPPAQAEEHDHEDREQRQRQLVVDPADAAQNGHGRVEHGEQMDDFEGSERSHGAERFYPGVSVYKGSVFFGNVNLRQRLVGKKRPFIRKKTTVRRRALAD